MDSGHALNGGSQFAPAFGGFMNDHTAQMGFQIGKSAAMAGQEYMEQNVGFLSCGSVRRYHSVN
jgi:hypothetical protein